MDVPSSDPLDVDQDVILINQFVQERAQEGEEVDRAGGGEGRMLDGEQLTW